MTFSSLAVWVLVTSSAWNENLPLLNTNISLISGKYGLRNHFWPLESRFLMRINEKNAFFSKPSHGRILISWNPILYTFLCTKIKKITIDNFFSLDACSGPMCPAAYFVFLGARNWEGRYARSWRWFSSGCPFWRDAAAPTWPLCFQVEMKEEKV